MIVSDVADRARKVFMNDADTQLYSNAVLLPFVQQEYGLGLTKEVSAFVAVPAGALPVITINEINDMVLPLELYERAAGDTGLYSLMSKLTFETEDERDDSLRVWNWRENEIKLLGALTDREVKVKYIKGLPALVNETSPILLNSSLEFLAARSSGLASRYIGGNIARADACDNDAGRLLPRLVSIEVKATQENPVRRRPFRARHHVG